MIKDIVIQIISEIGTGELKLEDAIIKAEALKSKALKYKKGYKNTNTDWKYHFNKIGFIIENENGKFISSEHKSIFKCSECGNIYENGEIIKMFEGDRWVCKSCKAIVVQIEKTFKEGFAVGYHRRKIEEQEELQIKEIQMEESLSEENIKKGYDIGYNEGKKEIQIEIERMKYEYEEEINSIYFEGIQKGIELSKFCPRCKKIHGESIHHIIPRENGGKDNIENLIVLCFKCHDYVEMETEKLFKNGKIYSVDVLRSFIIGEFPSKNTIS